MSVLQAIRGMNDILPTTIPYWQHAERVIIQILENYGYQEIRLPVVEKTELFKRTIGDVTDIVEKEMYTFEDRGGESVSLRPEATAGCIRAGIEHGLFFNQIQRLWCAGPMFRYERPQKGRYRQFYHIDAEAVGMAGPDIEAELILLCARIWKTLKIEKSLILQVNSLGSQASRKNYRQQLVEYFSRYSEKLDNDSQRRLHSNPLRILDSKNPEMADLIAGAPSLTATLDPESRQHFEKLCHLLENAGVSYQVNPRLVRGLDYYNHTVFEWVTEALGAQGTVCAGGRYDGLVEQLGGKSTPAVGFAVGLERLVLLLETQHEVTQLQRPVDLYFILAGETAIAAGLKYAEQLRDAFPDLKIITDCTGASFKSQFKRADQSQAKLALILGDDEIKNGMMTVKYLREEKSQESLSFEEVLKRLRS